MNSYISINSYRSSTSHGFTNTWKTYRISKDLRTEILHKGLSIADCTDMDGSPVLSPMGIRAATLSEIRDLKKEEKISGCEIAYDVEASI